jgi:2-amino-4-hydroxy-6-hydroxymethyldihydropteridine diphosphokinase
MTKHQVYLSLGSNLGQREENLRKAIGLINERVGEVVRQSSFIETEPWGFESDHPFMNAAVLCLTEKSPREVLRLTQQIEHDLGKSKEHATQRSQIVNRQSSNCKLSNCKYTDRPIDIDILLYDDLTVDEPDLQIPHPLMYERDFVMIPLKEIR